MPSAAVTSPNLDLAAAIRLAVQALSSDAGPNSTPREVGVDALEVAILDRTRALPRKFRRINGSRLGALLADAVVPPDPGVVAPPALAPESVPETDLSAVDGSGDSAPDDSARHEPAPELGAGQHGAG